MVHNGLRYNVELLRGTVKYDKDGGTHSRQNVIITDTKTNTRYSYVGRGQDIGNFHPIWVNINRESFQVESLLNVTRDIFPRKTQNSRLIAA